MGDAMRLKLGFLLSGLGVNMATDLQDLVGPGASGIVRPGHSRLQPGMFYEFPRISLSLF